MVAKASNQTAEFGLALRHFKSGNQKAAKTAYSDIMERDLDNPKYLQDQVEALADLRTHVLPLPSGLSTEMWPPPATM